MTEQLHQNIPISQFNPELNRPNALRGITDLANTVERETGISVVRLNVGNPNGPTAEESNEFMAAYFQDRSPNAGYDDHRGDEQLRGVVARALTKLNRLKKGELDANKICCVPGGTGGLNIAVSILNKPTVLVSEPFYPPWRTIVKRVGGDIDTFELRKKDNYLLNEEVIREKLLAIPKGKPIMLLYHFPNNPLGNVLNEEDARHVAKTLSNLVAEFPNLVLVQEDLYLATIRSDKGIYTPLPYLSDQAKQNTMWIHSPSKAGHGKDRGAILATTNAFLADRISKSASTFTLGMASSSLVGTAQTLTNLAQGIEPRDHPDSDPDSIRYATADFYQERMRIAGQAFVDIEKALDVTVLDRARPEDTGIPEGTYYLWPSLAFMKGKAVPPVFRNVIDHDTIESSTDIKMMLAHAYLAGLRPVTVAEGEIFTKKNNDMRIRLAPVDLCLDNIADAANTLKGVIAMVMEKELADRGASLKTLDIHVRSQDQLQSECNPKRVLHMAKHGERLAASLGIGEDGKRISGNVSL